MNYVKVNEEYDRNLYEIFYKVLYQYQKEFDIIDYKINQIVDQLD
jgi:hypothetical protein